MRSDRRRVSRLRYPYPYTYTSDPMAITITGSEIRGKVDGVQALRMSTADGVTIAGIGEGHLWSRSASVADSRAVRPANALEAALLIVPFVTFAALREILTSIGKTAAKLPGAPPVKLLAALLTAKQHACLDLLRDGRPMSLWTFGSTTINRLRAFDMISTGAPAGAKVKDGDTFAHGFATITDGGRFMLDPFVCHLSTDSGAYCGAESPRRDGKQVTCLTCAAWFEAEGG